VKHWLFTLLLLLGAPELATASMYDELYGSRSFGMGGAHIGLGDSNDTVGMNPAGMAMVRRFDINAQYSYGVMENLSFLTLSAVDSQTGPLAGGLSYTFIRGDSEGNDPALHRLAMDLGYAITPAISIGFTHRQIHGTYLNDAKQQHDINAYTAGVGMSVQLSDYLRFGAIYQNFIPTDVPDLLPQRLGFGLGIHANSFAIASDVNINLQDTQNPKVNIHAGVEYTFAQVVPFRMGYQRQFYTDDKAD